MPCIGVTPFGALKDAWRSTLDVAEVLGKSMENLGSEPRNHGDWAMDTWGEHGEMGNPPISGDGGWINNSIAIYYDILRYQCGYRMIELGWIGYMANDVVWCVWKLEIYHTIYGDWIVRMIKQWMNWVTFFWDRNIIVMGYQWTSTGILIQWWKIIFIEARQWAFMGRELHHMKTRSQQTGVGGGRKMWEQGVIRYFFK